MKYRLRVEGHKNRLDGEQPDEEYDTPEEASHDGQSARGLSVAVVPRRYRG